MINRATKASSSVLSRIADIVLGDVTYLNENFSQSVHKEKLLSELKQSEEPWNILSIDEPAALFRLYLVNTVAAVDKFLPSPVFPLEAIVSGLKQSFARMKVESLVLQAPERMIETLSNNGFQKLRILVRLSGPVVETNRMPILPLNNPDEKDIPALAKLMVESYAKSLAKNPLNIASSENDLRRIMTGARGPYVEEASLMSGTTQNLVSACLVTLSSQREAEITQLFTHPLYRARGLATTEIASSMNKLAKRDVQTLIVWIDEANEVARRLFGKLGLREDRKLVEMRTGIP